MRFKSILSFICLFTLVPFAKGQNLKYAKKTVKKLCSKKFAGRGYINNGAVNAGKFIAKEMKKLRLQTFAANYLEPYRFSVNTIETSSLVFFNPINKNKTPLTPGRDYLIGSGSPFVQDRLRLDSLPVVSAAALSDSALWGIVKQYKGKWIVVDTLSSQVLSLFRDKLAWLDNHFNILQFSNAKLTWDVSTQTAAFAKIIVAGRLRYLIGAGEMTVLIKSKLLNTTQYNVIGYVPGKVQPDSFLLVCAHYDHLGKMGTAVFPGANDNAAGVAMLLDLAKYYKKNPHNYTMIFVAFSGEEAGLLGSLRFVKAYRILLPAMRFVLNLDLVGTGETGMTVVNATVFTNDFAKLDSINHAKSFLPEIRRRGKAANSDHFVFTELGIPSFFCYLSGPRIAYHDIDDIPKTLSLKGYLSTYQLLKIFLNQLP